VFAARGLDVINLKKYNSLIFYIVYGVINISILLSSFFLFSLFISIEKVSNDDMNPSFFSDEYILVNKYSINNLDIGDVVIYSNIESVNTGRIIAKAGEEYRYEGGKFYINDAALPLGILSAEEMDYLGLDSFEELFYETNGKRRYPVKVFLENNIEGDGKKKNADSRNMNSVQIKKDMLLISYDNRTSDNPDGVIAGDAIKGRVEGVFLTFNFSRLFLKPYLND
jgi:signal peptidase I